MTAKELHILIVDDDPIALTYISTQLADSGYGQIRKETSAEDVIEYLGLGDSSKPRMPVDIILMDIELPGMNGFELTRTIKSDPSYTDVPVAFTSAYTCDSSLESAFDSGGVDFISKPIKRIELLARVRTLAEQRLNALELRTLAYFDPLTQLPNRALLRDRFEQLKEGAERHQRSFALLFLDLNLFKSLNDQYGHDVGDGALKRIANRIKSRVRRSDTVARLGGDEFVVLLDEVWSLEDATRLADDLVRAVRAPLEVSGDSWNLGVSIGIAIYPKDGTDYNQLLGTADQMMYQAKNTLPEGYCCTNGMCHQPQD